MKQDYSKLLGLILFSLILISGCARQTPLEGVLAGKITIGPLCPVETIPPNPACQPTLETYNAWPIAVYSPDRKRLISEIKPDITGDYSLPLRSGDYIIDLEKEAIFSRNLPVQVKIVEGKTTTLNIDIDTGIR